MKILSFLNKKLRLSPAYYLEWMYLFFCITVQWAVMLYEVIIPNQIDFSRSFSSVGEEIFSTLPGR